MRKYLLLSLILASSALHAEIITSKIHSIEKGLLKFENGRVAYLDSQSLDLQPDDYVSAEVNNRSSLLSITKLPSFDAFTNASVFEVTPPPPPPPFEPTVVQGMDEAWNIFNRSNSNYKRVSECSDRAHVWAHNEFKHSGTKSEKVFVFFTESYIKSVRFKWWFHVAPLYTVNNNGNIQKLVMDYRFTDRPMTVKEWTDQFVYTKRSCKVTTKFSEYDNNPQTENCYVIYESMHYKIPLDIENEETLGLYKTSTSESELKASYSFAFQQ
jgi:hypothetical protein